MYSAEDVEYCIACYHVMLKDLKQRGLSELVYTLSNDRCTPLKTVTPTEHRVVIAIVDTTSVICLEDNATGKLELPSAAFEPCFAHRSQREIKLTLREAWVACMGEPPSTQRFATLVSAQLRNPKRVGSMHLAYGLVPRIENILTAVENAFSQGPLATRYTLRVIPRASTPEQEQGCLNAQLSIFQHMRVDMALGVASPCVRGSRAQQSRKKGAAKHIQRIARGVSARRAMRPRVASAFAAVGKLASTENGHGS